MGETKSAKTSGDANLIYQLEGKPPLKIAVPLGLQHVLAMFVGNLTPLMIIMGICGMTADGGFAALRISLLQNAMLIAGIVTLVQCFTLGPVGGRVPIVMGTSSGFIGVMSSAANAMGGGLIGYGAVLGASFIGGLFEAVLGVFLKPLRKFFPPLVTGIVVMSIGLSLISVGVNSFGGGNKNGDFGSAENLFIGFFVLIVILVLKHGTKGFTSTSSILIGIIAGYVLCAIMGAFLPHTYTYTNDAGEAVEATKSWVLNWQAVKEAAWFQVPAFMPVNWVFDVKAIAPIMVMFVVTAVETIGDISGVCEGGMNREPSDRELSGGIMCDGLGSSFAALFGVLPNTSFSQNVGLVAMNKVVNLFTIGIGGVFLILCGLFPKLAALMSIMPNSVLGGAAVLMFSSIIVSGIQLVTKEPLTPRNVSIVATSLGVGYGLGTTTGALAKMPQFVQLIFGESGIVSACVIALVMNALIRPDKPHTPPAAEQPDNPMEPLIEEEK